METIHISIAEGMGEKNGVHIQGNLKRRMKFWDTPQHERSLKTLKLGEIQQTLKDTQGFPGGSDDKESACNMGDADSIPGSGRYPGEGKGNPLQYGVTKSQTQLRN